MGERRDDPDLAALRSGDEAAFRTLIQVHHGQMLRLAMAYVRDPGLAEEVVQESWLTCLRSLEKFEGRSSLKTWLFGIVMNIARSRRRRESRILPFASLWRRDDSDSRRPTVDAERFGGDGMWLSRPDSWPESKLLSSETLLRVKAAIESLPMKQREVITLRDVAGLDASEVCGLLSISAENQRVRLHRARASVRRMLEEYLR
ncbi:MAG TPA: sigma-70 family RNA polymerase sigma factor [Candidatus Acidoferrum sp.]|nr:sigma-70 family RNA polymerase sigma factor [Candidatus Acidoferrum sp.]